MKHNFAKKANGHACENVACVPKPLNCLDPIPDACCTDDMCPNGDTCWFEDEIIHGRKMVLHGEDNSPGWNCYEVYTCPNPTTTDYNQHTRAYYSATMCE